MIISPPLDSSLCFIGLSPKTLNLPPTFQNTSPSVFLFSFSFFFDFRKIKVVFWPFERPFQKVWLRSKKKIFMVFLLNSSPTVDAPWWSSGYDLALSSPTVIGVSLKVKGLQIISNGKLSQASIFFFLMYARDRVSSYNF